MLTDYRIDRGIPLHETTFAEKGEKTVFEGVAARVGIYLYKNPDGSVRRELVDERTFEKSTPIAGAPVTLHHPSSGRVDAHNSEKVTVGGVVSEAIEPNTSNLLVAVEVDDTAAEKVRGGLRGLSPGYVVKLDSKCGVHPKFGRYDARQISRDYNHLAIVGGPNDPARGGATTSLRVDAAVEILPNEATMIHLLSLLALLPSRTDSVDTSDEEAVAAAVKGGIEALLGANAAQVSEIEQLKNDAASAAEAQPTEADRLAWFTERTELLSVAERFNVDSTEALGNADLKKAVVLKALPSANAEAGEAYFAAAFDILSAQPERTDSQVGRGIKPAPVTEPEEKERSDSAEMPTATVLDFYKNAHISAQ